MSDWHFPRRSYPQPRQVGRTLGGYAAGLALALVTATITQASAEEVAFERLQLSDQFYSEGGTHGDYDSDGQGDVAIGPWIYYGPTFLEKSRYYAGEAFEPANYSENFLMYSDDVNADGQLDILVLGFPGKESWWYENPGREARNQLWKQHTILASVDNESPRMADIDGDGLEDLVCSSQGHYGYATHAGQAPTDLWRFIQISPNNGYQRFTHGLGVGDVNNDGHQDLMEKDGWWENPGTSAGAASTAPHWTFHPFAFSDGGSQMHAVDFDGDGRNEVLTGLAAHGFGLVYYRALDAAATQFERVEIMNDDPATSPVGVAVSQLHALELGDINRDGIPDIITGKRWWAHANHDPGNSQPATLLWLETQRSGGRVRFVPHVIDNSSGVGTQVSVGDVNGDGLLDIVSGIKRGAYLFLQRPADLPAGQAMVAEMAAADPYAQQPALGTVALPSGKGFVPAIGDRPLNFSFEAGDVSDWEMRGPMAATAISRAQPGDAETSKDGPGLVAIDTGSQHPELFGELISRPFQLGHARLTFSLAGKQDPEVRVELVDEATGKVLQAAVPEHLDWQQASFDIAADAGKVVRIRVVDHSNTAFLRVDDFRMQD